MNKMRKEILAKRTKIRNEIEMLNAIRFEEKKGFDDVNRQIVELKKRYNYYNSLLKVMK
jgi:hypothetical protein